MKCRPSCGFSSFVLVIDRCLDDQFILECLRFIIVWMGRKALLGTEALKLINGAYPKTGPKESMPPWNFEYFCQVIMTAALRCFKYYVCD